MSENLRNDEEVATQRRARILGMAYVDTSTMQKQLYKNLLPKEELYELKAVPLQADPHNVLFGITTTTPQTTMQHLTHQFLDQRISFAIISDTGYRDFMRLYDPPPAVVYHDIDVNSSNSADLAQQVSETLDKVRADDMLGYLVSQAHRLNASDIHLETSPDSVRIRFRIDGVLHPVATLTIEKYRVLVSVIASAGNISTSSEETQQGHIGQRVRLADGQEVDINLRLETAPTINGLDVVMRLFNLSPEMYHLDRLGLSEDQRSVVDGIISKPSGLVLIVGPTGSGKTTTLYSMLNSLNSDERKIITIEDPVEYQFPGISQLSVKSVEGGDSSFANKLRAVLRLDPDIVMVGEIRDLDTAHTALQAALTGHLVLSTFHASSAAAALTRLGDVIGENPLFVSAVRLVMAQRLVRRLDDTTKQAYQPTSAEMTRIYEVLKDLPPNSPKPQLEGLRLYKPGSSAENPYGYDGQIAIREQFTMDGAMHQLFETKHELLTTQQIEATARASGMRTMLQDAMLRVCAGETTLEEVYRVIG